VQDSAYIGAYWSARRESASACARRLETCLSELALVHPSLKGWRPTGPEKQAAIAARVVHSADDFQLLLAAGAHRRDTDGTEMPELGFTLGLWNGEPNQSAGITVSCGAWHEQITNAFVLKLPRADQAKELYELSKARAALDVVVAAWEPDWASMTSNRLRAAREWAPGKPVVGWLTYLSSERNVPNSLPLADLLPGLHGGKVIGLSVAWEEATPQTVLAVAEALERPSALS
jgi:Immunity protein 52